MLMDLGQIIKPKSVYENVCPTIKYLKNNSNYIFYIFLIDENSARWCQHEDKYFLKKTRKLKLEKLHKVN